MKTRPRVALLVALSFLLAGGVAIVASAWAYERSTFHSYPELNEELFAELGVTSEQVRTYLRAHPEAATDFNFAQPVTPDGRSVNDVFRQVQTRAQRDAVNRSRMLAAIALGILGVLAATVGWIVAGRILMPVRMITKRARDASATTLDARVALEWPPDELKELADTFDNMLERLEQSFSAQRHFSAQVSHELRTPLSVIRNETELLLSEDGQDPAGRASLERIRAASLRAERMIGALLALSKTESGNLHRERVVFDEMVGDVVSEVVNDPRWRNRRFDLELESANVYGDRALLFALVANLVDNAARHNRDGGWVHITVHQDGPRAVLRVTNSPPLETPDRKDDATDDAQHGVGMTVVAAIAQAHDGQVESTSTDDTVSVLLTLPAAIDGAPLLHAHTVVPS